MFDLSNIFSFLKRERIYLYLLAFIVTVNLLVAVSDKDGKKHDTKRVSVAGQKEENAVKMVDATLMNRDEIEKLISKNKGLGVTFGIASLLIFAVFLLGVVVNFFLLSHLMSGRKIDISTITPPAVSWSLWDVSKVTILFFFFGYILIIAESSLSTIIPLLKDENILMMINSSVLDLLAVVWIIYFTLGRYQEHMSSLGLSAKNFIRNVFYGIAGYVAAAPVLFITLLVISLIIKFTHWTPPKQPVVELFLKEDNATFLVYSGLFAAFLGPFIEEIFFRGFLYNALKKYVSISWSIMITAAIFAILHANIVSFFPIMILGMLLSYLYEKTGTLVSSITVHMAHNFGMVLLVFLIKQVNAG